MADKLVVFDLDETLVHATTKKLNINEDFVFDHYYVYVRPYLNELLSQLVTSGFRIGIWSSAGETYVEYLVKSIVPEEVPLELVWARGRCTRRYNSELDDYVYEKQLRKLKKRGFKLTDIWIVDDTPEKSRTNYGNAITIKEFNGDKNDRELQYLLVYLLTSKHCDNVRDIDKRSWRETILI